jgi:hypothetical protein
MEDYLSRPLLKGETVHHINGRKLENGIGNLQLFASNHGSGQRVEDIVSWSIEMLKRYPEFAERQGYKIIESDAHDGDGTAPKAPLINMPATALQRTGS